MENHHQGVVVHTNTLASKQDYSAHTASAEENTLRAEDAGKGPSCSTGNHGKAREGPLETPTVLSATQQCHDEAAREEQPQSQYFPSNKSKPLLGKSHPIVRCPSDVLRLIFEAACRISPLPITRAVTLSAVCHKWRRVALNTPRLWCEISFTLDTARPDPYFWSFLIPRIKMVPGIIKIHNVEAETADILNRCNLPRIPVLEYFGLYLSRPGYFRQLHTLPPFLPAAGAEHLLISYDSDEQDTDQETSNVTWDIGKLLQHIPPISKLWLAAPCTLLVMPSTQLTRITFLYLEEMRDLDVCPVISFFTQLSHLELFEVQFMQLTSPSEIYSPYLINLTICDCIGDESWLARATFPSLAAFFHTGPGFSDACMSFIQKHSSIITLELSEKGEQVACIPKIAPQIQSLAVDPWLSHLYTRDASGTDVIPFPSLQFLTVVTGRIPLTLQDFDGVVRTRCLPSSASQSQIVPSLSPLRSLTIRRYIGRSRPVASAPWKGSRFLQSAWQDVLPDAEWIDWELVTLSWV